MAVYVVPDSTGLLPAFYDDALHVAIPDGAVLITEAARQDFLAHQGFRIWNPKTSSFDPYTPPASSGPPPTVTGNQWAFALSSLGLSAAWQVGVTKSKASDQVRAGLIARDTPLLASDPLLIRIAANAGTTDGTADGPPLIKVAAVFSTAQTMPL